MKSEMQHLPASSIYSCNWLSDRLWSAWVKWLTSVTGLLKELVTDFEADPDPYT